MRATIGVVKPDSTFRSLTRHPAFIVGLCVLVSAVNLVIRWSFPEMEQLIASVSIVSAAVLTIAGVLYYRRSLPERLRRQRAELQSKFLADPDEHRSTYEPPSE